MANEHEQIVQLNMSQQFTYRYRKPDAAFPFEHKRRRTLEPQTRLENHLSFPPSLAILALARDPHLALPSELCTAHPLLQLIGDMVRTLHLDGDVLAQLE